MAEEGVFMTVFELVQKAHRMNLEGVAEQGAAVGELLSAFRLGWISQDRRGV